MENDEQHMPELFSSYEKAVLAILAHKKEKVWHIQDKCRMETCTAIILRPEETAAWQTWVCS